MTTLYVDQSDWGILELSGADAEVFLQNMCTANLAGMAVGESRRTCLLNPKGRVISVFDVVAREAARWLVLEPVLVDTTREALDHHIIMEDVHIKPVSAAIYRGWESADAVWTAPPEFGDCPEPFAPEEEAEIRRVEAGYPKYGVDVSADNFPFESGLIAFVASDKGCYVGQEPVARVRDRGAPQRQLRGLCFEGEELPAVGAVIAGEEKPNAGSVTSTVLSPAFGAIAIGYIHRSCSEPGSRVQVDGRSALVAELPFRQER